MLRAFCLIICTMVIVSPANADFILPVYSGLNPVESSESEAVSWELPLAKFQKIDGAWQLGDSLTLSGRLVSHTYLIQTRDRFNEISLFYQTWASQKSIETLFSCKSRACGSSNQWANGYFNERRLNGVQNKQAYWALKSGRQYMAMYLVERGTGQKMLRTDILTVEEEPSGRTVTSDSLAPPE